MGYGAQWEACFGDIKKVVDLVPEIVQSGVFAKALGGNDPDAEREGVDYFALEYGDSPLRSIAIIERDPVKGGLIFNGAFPFLQEGVPSVLKIQKLMVDEMEPTEAVLECTTEDGAHVSLFDPLYLCNREVYKAGEVYEFSIAALAYILEPVTETSLFIKEGPLVELARQRKLEEDPDADADSITSVEISMEELSAYFPQENGMDAEFQTVVEEVLSFVFEGTAFFRMRVVLMRHNDMETWTFLYASEHILKGYRPVKGDCIRGVLWLQGYPLRRIEEQGVWNEGLGKVEKEENLWLAVESEEYFSDLHIGVSAFCRSLVFTGWDVTKYDNPKNDPEFPVAIAERENRQVNVWVRAFVKDVEPEVGFTEEETRRYSHMSKAHGQEALWAVVECMNTGGDTFTFKYLNRGTVEAVTGEINVLTAARKPKEKDAEQIEGTADQDMQTTGAIPVPAEYSPTEEEQRYIALSPDKARAFLAVCFALAYNILEPSWITDRLACNATYGSQSVGRFLPHEDLEGRNAIKEYISGKMKTLRDSGEERLVRCELGFSPADNTPCVIVHQRENWTSYGIGDRAMWVDIIPDEEGNINKLFNVTVIPEPASARGTGIFPGVPGEKLKADMGYVPHLLPEKLHLVFKVFLIGKNIPFEETTVNAIEEVIKEYPSAEMRSMCLDTMTEEDFVDAHRCGVVANPTIIVECRGELIMKHVGAIDAKGLREKLKKHFFPLRLVGAEEKTG